MRALLFILILLVSVSCGSAPRAPPFARRLTHFRGGAAVIFFAVDADDEVLVTFRAAGLVTAARAAGVETTTVFDLPSDEVELVVEVGSRISDATCDDVIENSGPNVQRTWTAVAGTATVRIRPLDPFTGGRGDLVLEDVVFTAGGDEVSLERLEWLDISVGWFPG
jgi:hypothetical protein